MITLSGRYRWALEFQAAIPAPLVSVVVEHLIEVRCPICGLGSAIKAMADAPFPAFDLALDFRKTLADAGCSHHGLPLVVCGLCGESFLSNMAELEHLLARGPHGPLPGYDANGSEVP